MPVHQTILKELVKRGYSRRGESKIWDLSDSKLWYLTPELSEGFLEFSKYEPYRHNVLDRELKLIHDHAAKIITQTGFKRFNLIDLGCGSGRKASAFIEHLPKDIRARYSAVDISPYFIKRSLARVRALDAKQIDSCKSFVSAFDDFDEIMGTLRSGAYPHNVSLLLGETISHYEINDFLFGLSKQMFPGDVIIIGNGVRRGERFVHLDKYRTRLFDQWFIHIMRGLGFEDMHVAYDVRFTKERLEFLYHVLGSHTVQHGGKMITFKHGDQVIVGAQYKHYETELKKFFGMYFSKVEIYRDSMKEYCLFVCRK